MIRGGGRCGRLAVKLARTPLPEPRLMVLITAAGELAAMLLPSTLPLTSVAGVAVVAVAAPMSAATIAASVEEGESLPAVLVS